MARVLLGVTGGIAFYKSAELASKLTQRGDEVRTLLTPGALKFVTPLTFRALTRQPVYTDIFADDPAGRPEHISLPEWGDLVLVAPATADFMARVCAGLGDDILTVTLLACDKPVLFAPAMNDRMWANPIVQRNIQELRSSGYEILEPEPGYLACGSYGAGRLPEPESLIAAVDRILPRPGPSE